MNNSEWIFVDFQKEISRLRESDFRDRPLSAYLRMPLFFFAVAFVVFGSMWFLGELEKFGFSAKIVGHSLLVASTVGIIMLVIGLAIQFFLFKSAGKKFSNEIAQLQEENIIVMFDCPEYGVVAFTTAGFFSERERVFQSYRDVFFNVLGFAYDNSNHKLNIAYKVHRLEKLDRLTLSNEISGEAAISMTERLNAILAE